MLPTNPCNLKRKLCGLFSFVEVRRGISIENVSDAKFRKNFRMSKAVFKVCLLTVMYVLEGPTVY